MIAKIEKRETEKIHPSDIFPQTSYWGRIKQDQGFQAAGFRYAFAQNLLDHSAGDKEIVVDDLLVLIRYINPKQCFAYVPYGPRQEPLFENQGIFLESLSEKLRSHLPENCIYIRYDLMWQNQWAEEEDYFDEAGNWMGPPSHEVQEMRMNYSTRHCNLRKSPGDILPRSTFFIDLTLDEQGLLSNMRYNTRYNIRKAHRQRIEIKEYGIDRVTQWYALYQETARRSSLPQQSEAYFFNLLKKADTHEHGVQIKLLIAEKNGKPLAGMILALSQQRGIYLFGASSSDKGNLMASYALQWQAILMAKRKGCAYYDMFGSAPNLDTSHPLHGVHIFKKGFGGQLFHRMGCWDYPFENEGYALYKMHEISN